MPQTVVDAAAAVSVPREAPANSFVLHTPLELMARVGLLPYLAPDAQTEAIEQIGRLADKFTATGPAVDAPKPRDFERVVDAASALGTAIAHSDLDEVDATMTWLTAHVDGWELRHLLGEAVVDSLAAAAHTPIGLYLLPLVGDGQLPASLLRTPVRDLARQPEWRLDWFRDTDSANTASGDLAGALRSIPQLGRPGSDFIYPLMAQAEQSGAAPQVLAPLLERTSTAEARRTLARAAVWSMLHDDPEQAPYGWTHCLTMPQAVMALAGEGVAPRTALAVAATYVVGFRAAHGLEPLGALDDEADVNAVDTADPADLAAYASFHHDAHLVKYTLACIYAADADPAWARTYLAAAQYLGDWWRAAAQP